MSKTTTLVLAAVAAGLLAGAAEAQPRGGRGPSATLYDRPDFGGRSVTLTGQVGNLSNYGFNDRAHSLRLEGRWRLCEHANLDGRCVELTGDVPELNTMNLAERITSLEPIGRGGGGGRPGRDDDDRPGGGWGPGGGRPDRSGVEGARNVFFPRPQVRGMDLAAGSNGANAFCRRQGLGPAAHFDSSERAPRALGPEGQVTGPSPVLRDVLCRKW
ncbi:beta/gamma crystallin-related protein [Phenylobacterium sp.]|jgi:hypothetical protein|uniref:beta/gamma crystallin-related protein n=1 Tax=Phenylobacterium sp. TaxID=1871053 RepID=UPI002F92ECA4